MRGRVAAEKEADRAHQQNEQCPQDDQDHVASGMCIGSGTL
jgi:hypothetical protein